jgi:nucleoside-diphosphate-sugar epimerase
MTAKKVLIYGATGAIGTNLIQIMAKEQPEWTVLAASRSGGADSYLASLKLDNVEMVKSNIENLEDARKITQDVDMVFCCIGFPQYEAKYWAKHWPIVVDNLLEVTSSTRPLIFCDNLYAYGPKTNITTSTETVPPSLNSKPGVRATIRQSFQKRMESDPESIAVVGGADFFGPRLEGKTMMGDTFFGKIVAGEKPIALGSASVKHDFCYARDFSNALYIVAAQPTKSMGKFWICPHSVKNQTLNELATKSYGILGSTDKGVQVLPVWIVSVLGLFMGVMSNMKDMMSFWTNDYTGRSNASRRGHS